MRTNKVEYYQIATGHDEGRIVRVIGTDAGGTDASILSDGHWIAYGHDDEIGGIFDGVTVRSLAGREVRELLEGLASRGLSDGTGIVPSRIYFDMDGVLANFKKGMVELAGFVHHPEHGWNEAEDARLWAAVRKVDHFYDKLEPLPGSLELFHEMHRRYGDRCEILTGIPKPNRHIDTAGEDKVSWCRRFLPEGVKVNVVYSKEKKYFCDGVGSVLIDDFSENIEAWEEHGGTGVTFTGAKEASRELGILGIL